ncbi:BamA/TamA family outer membrane protein [Niveibacterium sp. 24ML]|uniref:ShlB/FhaC/HecB family hemolysin secretion/activation protein n=1 Tax=Niveibacterium sp. 24ML TaxID=2985512 RepID=UPI002271DAF8|nr:ShlB/FhaC/HecB family hemolysin secretion/activation protein [Niveibacterium sp. 24ML]MCX9156625.1 BamA/TamA family outer membrane protein [Niveibacterium sp. 24ML]
MLSPLFASAFALAQTPRVVPHVDELKREIEEAKPAQLPSEQPPAPPKPAPPELGKPADDIRIDVQGFRIIGLSESDPAPLEAMLQRFAGTGRSYEDLSNAAAAATEYLQSELGYYLGYAYLPAQASRDGIIEIAVMEGRLDRIDLDWNPASLIRRSVIEDHLSVIKPGEILRVRDVERMVFLLNDLLGGNARFEVKAGSRPGTATLVVTPLPDPRFGGQVTADNIGSRYSGEYRIGVGASMMSPLGIGDGLSLNGVISQTGGLAFALANYTAPLTRYGLKLGVSLSHLRYKLDEDDFPLGLEGTTDAFSAFAVYPLVRTRNLNLFAQIGGDQKDFVDSQIALNIENRKQTRLGWIGMVGDARDRLLGGGINSFSALYSNGEVVPENPALGLDNARAFSKLALSASRLQAILANRLLLFARYTGQIAFANLDSTERFSLGGEGGVRAYAPGEGSGDSGHVGTLELRFLPPTRWFDMAREFSLSAFGDWGYAQVRHDPSRQPKDFDNSIYLAGGGLGLVWERPQRFNMRLSVAWRATDAGVSDPADRLPRVYFVASQAF